MAEARVEPLNLKAECDCGAVTVTIMGEPASMFLCSCLNCQKVTGAGHSAVLLMPVAAVACRGETVSFTRPAESGAQFTRHFCPACGTTMHAESSRAAGLCILPVGIFAGDTDWFKPNQLIFARSQPAWDVIADHLPRHQSYRGAAAV